MFTKSGKWGVSYEPKSIPPIFQIRLGHLYITRHGDQLTVWWSHWLKVFHGEFLVRGET
jgi:hypothetical protein